MDRPSSGFNWVSSIVSLSLVLGLSGCSLHSTTIDSNLTLLVQERKFIRTNIGLLGRTPLVTEDVSLNQISDPSLKGGMFLQMVQGAWDGALSGFEVGQLFCWGDSRSGQRSLHISGKNGGTDALIFLILCGGGMVSGLSIGAMVGMLAPLVPPEHPTEILIARQHVVQGVWEELVTREEGKSTELNSQEESFLESRLSQKIFFGSQERPYTAFLRFERLRVGLFPKSYYDPGALTLVWNVQIAYLDHRRRVLAKQSIEMEQGEHSFETWADTSASFLKKKLREGYGLIAGEVVEKISNTAPS